MTAGVRPKSFLSGQTMARQYFKKSLVSCFQSFLLPLAAPSSPLCQGSVYLTMWQSLFLNLIPCSWHICVNSCADTTEVAIEGHNWPGYTQQHSYQEIYTQSYSLTFNWVLPCPSSNITVLNNIHQNYIRIAVGEKCML